MAVHVKFMEGDMK